MGTLKRKLVACRFRMRILLHFGLALAALLVAALATPEAHADDGADIVVLVNGSRLAGTVIDQDPQKGTSLRLANGTIKRFAPKDVKRVIYGGGLKPESPPAPVETPPPAVAPPPTEAPAIVAPGPPEARADEGADTVVLANGMRQRGVVLEQDPQKGTSIRLPNGTIKRFARNDVQRVIYGGGLKPAASPAPAETPAPAVAPAPAAAPTPTVVPVPTVAAQATTPVPPSAGSIPVVFESSDSWDKYHLSVLQPGRPEQACNTPCTLHLQPGSASVVVAGDATFIRTFVVTPKTLRMRVSRQVKGQINAARVILLIVTIDGIIDAAMTNNEVLGTAIGQLAADLLACGVAGILWGTAGHDDVAPADNDSSPSAGLRFRGVGACPLQGGGGVVGARFTF
jgi:hypothetical protein